MRNGQEDKRISIIHQQPRTRKHNCSDLWPVTARICEIESCTVDSEGNVTDFGICSLYDPFIAAVNGDLRAGRLGEDWPDNSTGQGRHISRGDFNA